MKRQERRCPICGGSEKKCLYRNSVAAIAGIDLSYCVVACKSCHAVFADEIAQHDEYVKYYSSFSKYDTGEKPIPSICLMHQNLVDFVGEYNENISGIVDMGCGSGNLLALFGEKYSNAKLVGFDPSPDSARKRLCKFPNVEIRRGFIESIDALDHSCNVFCITSVLEHIEDPYSVLRKLYNYFTASDCLAVEVPDINSFDGKNGEPYGEFSLEHINFFSASSLKSLLAKAGFEVIALKQIRYANNTGSLLALSRKNKFFSESGIDDDFLINEYILKSELHWQDTIEKGLRNVDDYFYVFGAGAHTAKLIGRHKDFFSKHCLGIVDNNRNLHNSTMGGILVESPSSLPKSCCSVLLSSFREELTLENEVKKINPFARIVKFYS